ncbi:unnamed protein product [Prorocentrum cordatum]|uniref:prolyl aminopeptidase n=1 Tax=Prorocentrum cordatum TaxID=2364126 RepID=A0ABN9QVV2_9DINO|nr:unnamed protein product [Polarella glacialis]
MAAAGSGVGPRLGACAGAAAWPRVRGSRVEDSLASGGAAGCLGGLLHVQELFDPALYRVVLFDQRGCGRSRRAGGAAEQLRANTTWDLVDDMERLRERLRIDRWLVAGGSWGSCLALAYAARHPARVLGVVLRAACLFRDEEFDFFLGPGAGGARCAAPPGAWESLTEWIPGAEGASGHAIASAFCRAALGRAAAGIGPEDAVSRWLAWEGALMAAARPVVAGPPAPPPWPAPLPAGVALAPLRAALWLGLGDGARTQALLTMRYVERRGFFPRGFSLLEEARGFAFPLAIVHGRNDCICPVKNATDLAAAAPQAELLLTEGGHSQWDPENVSAFVGATDRFAARLQPRGHAYSGISAADAAVPPPRRQSAWPGPPAMARGSSERLACHSLARAGRRAPSPTAQSPVSALASILVHACTTYWLSEAWSIGSPSTRVAATAAVTSALRAVCSPSTRRPRAGGSGSPEEGPGDAMFAQKLLIAVSWLMTFVEAQRPLMTKMEQDKLPLPITPTMMTGIMVGTFWLLLLSVGFCCLFQVQTPSLLLDPTDKGLVINKNY